MILKGEQILLDILWWLLSTFSVLSYLIAYLLCHHDIESVSGLGRMVGQAIRILAFSLGGLGSNPYQVVVAQWERQHHMTSAVAAPMEAFQFHESFSLPIFLAVFLTLL